MRLWEDVESWILGLDDETYNVVAAAITRSRPRDPRSAGQQQIGSEALVITT
ncbi:MAG: hypothetical protein LBC97_09765 [Bifidobacteriaceae bacterium]|nr:hypothetical protein [Bifidobacteriaceae bacterium]